MFEVRICLSTHQCFFNGDPVKCGSVLRTCTREVLYSALEFQVGVEFGLCVKIGKFVTWKSETEV